MRPICCCLLLISLATLATCQGRAQQRPAAAPVAPALSAPGTVDVMVRTNGDELAGQVVHIRPKLVHYLPPPAADNLPFTDTLRLAAAELRLIRYADGTQNLLRPAEDSASVVPALIGLSRGQRYERGRQDARLHYQPAKGVLWGTLASTAVAGPAGLIVGSAVAATAPRRPSLKTSNPALLTDPAYYAGYRRQAHHRKIGKAAIGLGAGTVTFAFVYTVVAAIISSTLFGGDLLKLY